MDKQSQTNDWSRLYRRQITEKEYKEICDNLSGFFKMLYAWDKERMNDNEKTKEFMKPIDEEHFELLTKKIIKKNLKNT